MVAVFGVQKEGSSYLSLGLGLVECSNHFIQGNLSLIEGESGELWCHPEWMMSKWVRKEKKCDWWLLDSQQKEKQQWRGQKPKQRKQATLLSSALFVWFWNSIRRLSNHGRYDFMKSCCCRFSLFIPLVVGLLFFAYQCLTCFCCGHTFASRKHHNIEIITTSLWFCKVLGKCGLLLYVQRRNTTATQLLIHLFFTLILRVNVSDQCW